MTLISLHVDNNHERYQAPDNHPSPLTNIAATTNYLMEAIANAVRERPYLASTLVLASAIPLSLKIYSFFRPKSLTERISNFIQRFCSISEVGRKECVKNFIYKHLRSINKNRIEFESATTYFLEEKIKSVCCMPGTLEARTNIINNILLNFENVIDEILVRFKRDATNGNLDGLGISSNDKIKSIAVLGDETHNKGQVPIYSITTKNSRFVYKSRSMIPERLLCGHQESLYEALGWPTYKIICCEDQRGQYGFCEFLTNSKEENTFYSVSELEEYFCKLAIIDELVVKKIGVADLHYLNIVTSNKTPFIIDAECFLNPPNAQIGMFDPERGAAWVYDLSYEGKIKQTGKNRIWLSDSLISNLPKVEKRDLPYRFPRTIFDTLSITCSASILLEKEIIKQRIESLQNALTEIQPRFILCSTEELLSFTQDTNLSDDFKLTQIVEAILENAKELGFDKISEANSSSILVRLKEDINNNDLPIFYYDHKERAIYYHDIIVARKTLENDVLQEHTRNKKETAIWD